MNFLLYVNVKTIGLTLFFVLIGILPDAAFGQSATIDVFVASHCRHCDELEDYLQRENISYKRIDLEKDSDGERDYLRNVGRGTIPAIRVGSSIIRGHKPLQLLQAVRKAIKESPPISTSRSDLYRRSSDSFTYSDSELQRVEKVQEEEQKQPLGSTSSHEQSNSNLAANNAVEVAAATDQKKQSTIGNTNTQFSGGYLAPRGNQIITQTNWDRDFKPYVPGADTANTGQTTLIIVGLFILLIYLIPTIVAFSRGHPNRYAIAAVNIFLGATGIIWFVALLWAMNSIHSPKNDTSSAGGESGLNIFVNDVRKVEVVNSSFEKATHEIDRLASLYQSGMLDEAEFTRLKKQALQG